MKSLYDKNNKYSEEARTLNREAHNALKPIFKAWVKMEYNPREIAHLINGTITDFELEFILERDKI